MPDMRGGLQVDLGDMKLQSPQLRPDGSHLGVGASDGQGTMVTVFLWKADVKGGATGCRDREWPNDRVRKASEVGMAIKDMKRYEQGEVAIVEYRVPEVQGYQVNQKSVHAYVAVGNMCGEVHISRTPFRDGDEAVFSRLLSSVHAVPEFEPGTLDYFRFGSMLYRQEQYKLAAHYYERTMELDSSSHELSPTLWKVLVDQMGMAYGISGDLKRAKAVFEEALKKEPTYPMFYYNLACAYAEMGDLDAAMSNLQKAFEYRKNVIEGERMPDPEGDDSFKRYLKNEKFSQALKALPRD